MGDAWIAHADQVRIDPGAKPEVEAFHEFAHLTVPPGNYVFVGKGAVSMLATETTVWIRLKSPHEGDVTPVTVTEGLAPFALAGIMSLGTTARIIVEAWTNEWPVAIDAFRLLMMQVDSLHWPEEWARFRPVR
jgi:hypothetical protein